MGVKSVRAIYILILPHLTNTVWLFRSLRKPSTGLGPGSGATAAMSDYSRWNREAATERALAHSEKSSATTDDGKYVYNFAFGSNLNPDKVKSRKMTPVKVMRGILPDWRLLFNHVGGYGNIERLDVIQEQQLDLSRLSWRGLKQPDEVHGVLLKLSRDEFAQMAWEEYAYNTVEVAVQVYPDDCEKDSRNGEKIVIQHALAFKTHPCAVTTSRTLPSSRYIKLIKQGARKSGIQETYCQWLDSVPSS